MDRRIVGGNHGRVQETGRIGIAYVATGAYVRMAIFSAFSCLRATALPNLVNVFIFVHRSDRQEAIRLLEMIDDSLSARIQLQGIEAIEGLPRKADGVTAVQLARLTVPELLGDFGRVIYIDADTVVCGDILDLAELDMGQSGIGACVDMLAPKRSWSELSCRYHAAVDDCHYVNSGVLVFDPPRWERVSYEWRQNLGHVTKFRFPDQDLVNIVYHGRIQICPAVWNVVPVSALLAQGNLGRRMLTFANELSLRCLEQDARLHHFVDRTKPGSAHYPEIGPAYKYYKQIAALIPDGESL